MPIHALISCHRIVYFPFESLASDSGTKLSRFGSCDLGGGQCGDKRTKALEANRDGLSVLAGSRIMDYRSIK